MRIMAINTIGDPEYGGGAERVMETLMLGFRSRGHLVSIAAISADPGVTNFMRNDIKHWRAGIRNLYWPRLDRRQPWLKRRLWHLLDVYNPFMKPGLKKILDDERPDVVITHNLTGWSISAIDAIKSRNIPIVQVLHDHYFVCSNSAMFKASKNCISQCRVCRVMRAPHRRISHKIDAVVGVSRYILNRHIAYGVFSNAGTREVIHNAVSSQALGLDDVPPLRLRAEPGRIDHMVRFGFIGAVAPHKGIELLLKIFTEWSSVRSELWVAGTGDEVYVNRLRAEYADKSIRFLGRVTPKNFFSEIDVLVVPSLWQENFPGVIGEAAIFGVPIIASERGGIPELSRILGGIRLFDPSHPTQLISAFESFMDAGDRSRASAMNTENLGGLINFDEWIDRYLNVIYTEVSKI